MFLAAADEPFPHVDLVNGVDKPDWYFEALPNFVDNPIYVDLEACGLDYKFGECLRSIRLLAVTYQTAADCEDTRKYLSVLSFLLANMQRVLSLPSIEPQGSTAYFLAEAVRSTLVLHVFSQWVGHQPNPEIMVSQAQHKLKEALTPLMVPGAGSALLLWLLAAGGVGALGAPVRTWYVGHLAAMVTEMGIETWEQMRSILQSVIWHDLQDAPTHKLLWDEVVERIEYLDS